MRLLRLVAPDGFAIDFHPLVSVVRGLDADRRRRVLDAVEGLAKGSTAGTTGLVEAHGIVLDLTSEALELLALKATDAQVVVTGDDLPGREHGLPGHDPEQLDAARAALHRAQDQLAGARDGAAAAREELRSVRDRVASLTARIEQLGAGVDGAEATAQLDPAGEPAGADESPETRLARLEDRRAHLDGLLAALTGADPEPVLEALEELRSSADVEPPSVLSAPAGRLADELDALRGPLEEPGDVTGPGDDVVEAARRHLERAEASLAEAEAAVRVPELDRDDVEALEQAHAEVLEALDRAEGRFARGRQERRLEQARAIEAEALGRLGFNTYTEYMMSTSLLNVDADHEEALARARVELAEAEDAWEALRPGIEVASRRAELLDLGARLREEAVALLGDDAPAADDDLPGALRSLRVPGAPEEVAAPDLARALQAVGFAIADEQLTAEDLAEMAREWLAEEERAAARRDAVLAERDDVDRQLSEVSSELGRAVLADREPPAEAGADRELQAELEAELGAARSAEEEAGSRAEECDDAVAAAVAEVERCHDALAELEERAPTAPAPQRAGRPAEPGDVEALEWYLLARLAAQRRVSYAGSVPLVIHDEVFAGIDADAVSYVLGRLERMAVAVQLVVLGDEPTVEAWAREVGEERAALVGAVPSGEVQPLL